MIAAMLQCCFFVYPDAAYFNNYCIYPINLCLLNKWCQQSHFIITNVRPPTCVYRHECACDCDCRLVPVAAVPSVAARACEARRLLQYADWRHWVQEQRKLHYRWTRPQPWQQTRACTLQFERCNFRHRYRYTGSWDPEQVCFTECRWTEHPRSRPPWSRPQHPPLTEHQRQVCDQHMTTVHAQWTSVVTLCNSGCVPVTK